MFRSQISALIVVGTTLGLSACNEDPVNTDPPEQYVWEARDIVSNGTVELDFSADAYIVAQGGIVDTGIRISNAEVGTQYGWLIRAGTCGTNGNLLSSDPNAFPIVTILDNGVGEVARVVFGFLEGTEQFNVEVYLDPLNEPSLVGCGPMVQIEDLPNF
jgi:hypothetical protein